MRWFHAHAPQGAVTIRNLSDDWGGIAIFGPESRALLARVTEHDVSGGAFPFMSARMIDIGVAPTLAIRLSVTGELGYELHAPQVYLRAIYDRLLTAASELGVVDAGMYCLLSLRIEKGFGIWTREFSRDYTPVESGLSRFIAYDKPAFIGRDAALRDREAPPTRRLRLLEVEAHEADASFYEPIWAGQHRVGFVTSAAFGHSCGRSLALGYVGASFADPGQTLEVTILGERHACRVLAEPPVDPRGLKMRA